MNLIFTYLISWNKPVHEIMVPIAYASSEGSDEPAHPRKIASALTAHIQWFIYNFGLMGPGTCCFRINKSQLQTCESKSLFLMTSLQYYCIPEVAGTRWSKNVCVKDAGCSGNKITDIHNEGACRGCESHWDDRDISEFTLFTTRL